MYFKFTGNISFLKPVSQLFRCKNIAQDLRFMRYGTEQLNDQLVNVPHVPVMAKEVMQYLMPAPGQTIVDMTFGAGGHSKQILESTPDIKILALDRDPIAYEYAQRMSQQYPGQVLPLLGRFSELPELLKKHKISSTSIDAFLFDFGCSSMQFDVAERGFSISKDGPLDMRMDGFRCPNEPTAADVIERADEEDLARIIKQYGEEKRAKKIARALVEARYTFKRLDTTRQLAKVVESVLSNELRKDMLGRFSHSATKTFQALRIFVNNELNEINYGIIVAKTYLKMHGRLLTISFHSLEDTIIKRHITGHITNNAANKIPLKYMDYGKSYSKDDLENILDASWKMLHKHVITPTDAEVEVNPRSRSAKLRAATKIS